MILACVAMGVGYLFGSFAESRRRDPAPKKRRRKQRVRCPECGEENDPSETDECEHCGEELPRR